MLGRFQTAHVARLRVYADSELNVTADMEVVFHRVAEPDDRSLIVLVE